MNLGGNSKEIGTGDLCSCTFVNAKLNLRLKVEGRRPDGLHLLSMLNVRLDLADELMIRIGVGSGVALSVSYAEDVARGFSAAAKDGCEDVSKNLASRAVNLLLQRHSLRRSVQINLLKRIPAGGGLGGGSSDAAAALLACSELLNLQLSSQELSEIGLAIGADVPYFLQNEPAWVSGVGEIVQPISDLPIAGDEVMLLFPAFELSTPAVYTQLRATPFRFESDEIRGAALETKEQVHAAVCNDLEVPAGLLQPQLIQIIDEIKLLKHALTPGMTGSGSTIFVLPKLGPKFSDELKRDIRYIAEKYRTSVVESSILGPRG